MAKLYMSVPASIVLVLFLSITIIGAAGCNRTTVENPAIAEVENNLLPPVLIEGEAPYNLAERMAFYHVPGVSIAVIKDFKIDWVKHYGLSDAASGDSVTDSTLFGVGSLSKAAAAATILHLVDQGKINLDDNVNDYLKSWKVPENKYTAKATVSIRRLLNHSSGLMSTPPHSYAPEDMPTLIQYLNAEPPLNIPPTRVDYEPGTAFKYANAGFSALQILAEDVTGEPFPVFAREVLFDPLKMKYSTFEQPLPAGKAAYAAAGSRADGSTYELKRYAYPSLAAGGLWTTVEEYARFIIEIQRTLQGQSHLIMSQELARQMTTPHDAKEYGLGVFMRYTDEVTYFSHMGDLRGFVAGFTAHPTAGYGAVIMTNSDNGIGLIREIMGGIARVYNWQTYLPPARARYHLTPEVMKEYTGQYSIGFDDVCTIYEKDSNLFYQTAGMNDFQLYPVAKDTLLAKDRLGQLVFVAETDGKVTKCIPHFADVIGRLPAEETEATKMAEGEKTPLELLLAGNVEQAIAAYMKYKKDFPKDPAVAERRFNGLGYQLLNQNKISAALAVFQLNVDLYPQSGNCWDSLAEALLADGNRTEALRHYRKAFELDPLNSNAANWIEKLETEN